jgi:hypothetical protein
MVFSSQLSIFYFLPIVLPVYFALPQKARHLGLTLFSYVFYSWANPWFVFLMLGTTAVDYVVGLWEQPHYSFVGSPVIDGDRIYMAGERLVCLDWETGKLVWSGGSYGYGGACIVTADDKLIVWSNLGRVALVASARESPAKYKQLARITHVVDGAESWPPPVLACGRLYCKDRTGKLKCFAQNRSAS